MSDATPRSRSQMRRLAIQRADDRPATTDQEPMVYGGVIPTPQTVDHLGRTEACPHDDCGTRLPVVDRPTVTTDREWEESVDVIANWLAMADYAHARDAYAAAQNLRKVLDSKGYTVAPKVAFPHKGMTPEQSAEWWERWIAAARASRAVSEPTEATDGSQGTADGAGATEGRSEPPLYLVEVYGGRWGPEFGDLADARVYAEYCREAHGETRIVRVTREVIQ